MAFYRYDLVDLTRQVLSKYANQVYLDAVNAFRVNDTKTFNYQSQKFLQLVKDIEELLAADDNFLLGTWLETAKDLAMNHKERKQVRILPSYTCFLLIVDRYILSCSTMLYSCVINRREEGQEVKKNELGAVSMGPRVVHALL